MASYAKRMDGITGSAIREIFKLLSKGDIISFGGGNPSASSFPTEEIRGITDDLLREKGSVILQYGPTEGYAPLVEGIRDYTLRKKGLDAKTNEILPLSGSIQGMDLLCKIFIDRGDAVLVEAPTFLGVLQTLHIYGCNIVPVDSDDEGMLMDDLEAKIIKYRPKMLYCIPTFQNPSGKTLGLSRRMKIAELAEKYDFIVAEDDPYCDLRYSGEALPPIKKFDKCENVVLLNSFSKIVSPGLRVGCAYGKAEIIRKMTVAKQGTDTHTSNLSQAIVAELIGRGLMDGQIQKILPDYKRRLDAMLGAMDKYFPKACHYTRPEGGLFVWGEMPGANMLDVLHRAMEEIKVAYIPGEHFYIDPENHHDTFRFNFSGAKFEDIEIGLKKLGGLLSSL